MPYLFGQIRESYPRRGTALVVLVLKPSTGIRIESKDRRLWLEETARYEQVSDEDTAPHIWRKSVIVLIVSLYSSVGSIQRQMMDEASTLIIIYLNLGLLRQRQQPEERQRWTVTIT